MIIASKPGFSKRLNSSATVVVTITTVVEVVVLVVVVVVVVVVVLNINFRMKHIGTLLNKSFIIKLEVGLDL